LGFGDERDVPDRPEGPVDVISWLQPALPDDIGLRYVHGRETEIVAGEVMPQEGDPAASGRVFWGPVERTSL